MKLVVMCLGFEMTDRLLPVGGQNVAIIANKALIHLFEEPLASPSRNVKTTHVRPCSLIELGYWSKTLASKLDKRLAFNRSILVARSILVESKVLRW